MARYKNAAWNLPEQPSWEAIHAGLLMDIRDELQKLNKVFACPNFLDVPFKLARIERGLDPLRDVPQVLRTISRKIPVRRKVKR